MKILKLIKDIKRLDGAADHDANIVPVIRSMGAWLERLTVKSGILGSSL